MGPSRIVELMSESTGISSGALVADRIVLTASHAVDELSHARLLRTTEWHGATVAWRSAEHDLALVRLDGAGPAVPPLRWGTMTTTGAVPAYVNRFPRLRVHPDLERDADVAHGLLDVVERPAGGRLSWSVAAEPSTAYAQEPAGTTGMAGAPVLVGGRLVGVVVSETTPSVPERLEVQPVDVLAADPEVARVCGDLEIGVATPEIPVSLPGGARTTLAAPHRVRRTRRGQLESRPILPGLGPDPLLGRAQELVRLMAWCEAPEPNAVLAIAGDGSTATARTAREVAARMLGFGWRAGLASSLVRDGATVRDLEEPTLVVVEDADDRTDLVAALIGLSDGRASAGAPIRILLVTRRPPERWQSSLGALQEVAQADGGHGPQRGELLALLGAPPADHADPAHARLLGELLDRERRRWVDFPLDVPLGSPIVHQTVVVAVLTAPSERTELYDALAAVPGLRDSETRDRERVADWLAQTYPDIDHPFATGSGALTGQLLAECPELGALLGGLVNAGPDRAAHMVSLLARTARRPDVRAVLHEFLETGLEELITTALRSRSVTLADALVDLLVECPQPATAHVLVDRLPERSTALAALAAELTTQALDHCPPGDEVERSRLLTRLSRRLTRLGRYDSALTVAEDAAAVSRELAESESRERTCARAAALGRVASCLSDLERAEDALSVAEDAVALFRSVDERPEVWAPDHVLTLTSLSSALLQLGRHEEALAAVDEAVACCRKAAAGSSGACAIHLGPLLDRRAFVLKALGRPGEGLVVAEEAVRLCRALAAGFPVLDARELASSLLTFADLRVHEGRWREARAAVEEALGILRAVVAVAPEATLPTLTRALMIHSRVLGGLGSHPEALAAAEEAVTLQRELLDRGAWRSSAGLAAVLHSLALRLDALGRLEERVRVSEEATQILRELAAVRPEVFAFALAQSLRSLWDALDDAGRLVEASAAIDESVEIYRALPAERPAAHRPALAKALCDRARALGRLGRDDEQLLAAQESVDTWRELVVERPGAFAAELAAALGRLALARRALGMGREGLEADEEAVDLWRGLLARAPDVHLATRGLAWALRGLGSGLRAVGQGEDALAASQEAVSLLEGLADAEPEAFGPDLAEALYDLSTSLALQDRWQRSQAAIDEAVALYEHLAATRPDRFMTALEEAIEVRSLVREAIASSAALTEEAGDAALVRGLFGQDQTTLDTRAQEFLDERYRIRRALGDDAAGEGQESRDER